MLTIILILSALMIILISVVFIVINNSFTAAKVGIEKACADIDTALLKRRDFLSQLSEIINDFAGGHVVYLENRLLSREKPNTMIRRESYNDMLDAVNVSAIRAAERYPSLVKTSTYLALLSSLRDTKQNILSAAALQNAKAAEFNEMLLRFPYNIVANLKGYTKEELFESRARGYYY